MKLIKDYTLCLKLLKIKQKLTLLIYDVQMPT